MPTSEVEAEILMWVIRPEVGDLPPAAAKALLGMGFAESDHVRMAELLVKAQDRTLTQAEQPELDGYINVSHLIALIQSKARASLKRTSHNPSAA